MESVTTDAVGADFAFVARIDPLLRALFRTAYPVATLPVPGAMAREICLDAAIDHRALVLIAGADGEALASTAESLGKEVLRVVVPPGQQVEPAHLRRFLLGPEVDTVVVAHVESTTGTVAPLAELADVLRPRKDIHFFIDASLSAGAIPLETDRWNLDTVLASGDGSLGMPHGVSFVTASPRMLKRAGSEPARGRQLDLVAHHTAAVEGRMLAALDDALAQSVETQLNHIIVGEGLMTRWERQARLGGLVERWVAAREKVQLMGAPARRAATLSWLLIAAGQAAAPRRRLDHAGEMTPEELAERLAVLGPELDQGQISRE